MPFRTPAPVFASSPAPVQGSVPGASSSPSPLAARAGHSLARVPVQSSSAAPIQCGKTKTAPQVLTDLENRGIAQRVNYPQGAPGLKTQPKRMAGYTVHQFGNKQYYVRKDGQGRVIKLAGGIRYTKAKRSATGKVANKRKTDVSGHGIAHSLGAPPSFKENYFALNKRINSASGAYGKMEHYLRKRMMQKGIGGYMSVKFRYPTLTMKRPDRVESSARFNRSPYKVDFGMDTL
jgi:hypothetical protein